MMLQARQCCRARVPRVSHRNGVKISTCIPGLQHYRRVLRVSTSSDGREPAKTADSTAVDAPVPVEPVVLQPKPVATAVEKPPAEAKPSTLAPSTAAATPDPASPAPAPAPAPASPSSAPSASSPSSSTAEEPKEPAKQQSSKLRSFPVELSDDDMFGTKGLIQELTDQQTFGKRGEAWFFAQMLVCLLILFPPMELKGLLDLIGTLAISAGLVFLVYALFCLGRSLSPLPAPRQENKLVTTGMYGYVRHPMYGGLILVAVGMTLVTGSESRLALSLLLWWILEQKANVEEMLLEQLYPEYKSYKERVKKFIPYVY